MTGRRLYLAGPMTGLEDLNRPAFTHWATLMRHFGWEVTNPAELEEPKPEATWSDWMRVCLPHVLACDVVAMLDGWEASKGARLEYDVAKAIGTPVVRVSELGPAYGWPPRIVCL